MKVWALLLVSAVLVQGQHSETYEDSRGMRPPPKPYRPPASYNNRPSQNYVGKSTASYSNKGPLAYGKEPGPNYYNRPPIASPIKQTYNKDPYGYNDERPYRPLASYDDYAIVHNPTYGGYPLSLPSVLLSSPLNPFPSKSEILGETFFDVFSGIIDGIKQLKNTTLSGLKPIVPILAENPVVTTAQPTLAQSTLVTTERTTTSRPKKMTTPKSRRTTTKRPKKKSKEKNTAYTPYLPLKQMTASQKPVATYQNPMMMAAPPLFSQPCPITSSNPGGYSAPQGYPMNQSPQNYPMTQAPHYYPMNQSPPNYPMNQPPQNFPLNQPLSNNQLPTYNSQSASYQPPMYQGSPQQIATYASSQPSSTNQPSSQTYYSPMQQRPASSASGVPYPQNVYSQTMGDGSQPSQPSTYKTAEPTLAYSYDVMQNNYPNYLYPAEGQANYANSNNYN